MTKFECAYESLLVLAAFLNTTVFGYLLLFAVVIMPGIGQLSDGEFLHAFQVMDGIIQDNEVIFIMTWMGSFLSVIAVAILSLAPRDTEAKSTSNKILIVLAASFSTIGQVITSTVHLPRNNRVHTLVLDEMDDQTLLEEREIFESSWNAWNVVRTVLFGIAGYLLTVCLLKKQSVLFQKSKSVTENQSILDGSHLRATYI